MRADKKIMRYIAGLLCMVLLVTTVFPQMTVNASAEQTDTENIAEGETTDSKPEDDGLEEQSSLTDIPEPLSDVNVKDTAEDEEISSQTEYSYEDGEIKAVVNLHSPEAVPTGSELKVRLISKGDEEQKDRYASISAYMAEKSVQDQFAIDAFLAYDIYFVYDGQEIIPSEGGIDVTLSFKNENVPDSYKDSLKDSKELKLYQLQEAADSTGNLSVNDMQDRIRDLVQNDNGSVDEIGFTMDSYLPLIITWKQAPVLTYEYSDEEVRVQASVSEMGVLPQGAELKVEKITDIENYNQIETSIQEMLGDAQKAILKLVPYDISFYKDGEKIEPDGTVNISLQVTEGVELPQDGALALIHQKDDGTAEEKEAFAAAEDGTVTNIEFESNDFSVYTLTVLQNVEDGEEIKGITCVSFTDAGPLLGPVYLTQQNRLRTASASARDVQPDNGLELRKKAVKDGDDYNIQLEAYATGTVSSSDKVIPTDIVLVLDESGSMTTKDMYSYTEVKGTRYYSNRNYNYGFSSGNYSIKLADGTYQSVTWYGRDANNIDYYRYRTGGRYVYVYPVLEGSYNSIGRAQNYDVVQFYEYEVISRQQALKNSVEKFANLVAENALENEVDHRIAVVGYSNEGVLFDGSTRRSNPSTSQYRNAFKDMSTTNGLNSILSSKNNIAASGSTYVQYGMSMAQNLFLNDTKTGERNRVVVMFTDGRPGYSTNGFYNSTANSAIDYARQIKSPITASGGCGATVYTIGVLDNGDPDDMSYNFTGNSDSVSNPPTNRYMNLVSSNYPNARSMSNTGAGSNQGYYLVAGNEEELTEIFEKIQGSIETPKIELDSSTVIKDYVTQYFDNISNVKAYIVDYKGNDKWADRNNWTEIPQRNISVNGKQVSVTGFNYSENFVTDDDGNGKPRGKKVVIEFNVKRADGFIGGNNVPTNENTSAVYRGNGTKVEAFEEPLVDVELLYDYETQDRSIYITNDWQSVEEFLKGTSGSIPYLIGGESYNVNGTNNHFADIVYTVKDKDGKMVGKYTVKAGDTSGTWSSKSIDTTGLTKDTVFTITAKVTASVDKTNGVDDLNVDGKDATLYVWTPTVNSTDTEIFLGETTDLAERVDGSVAWGHSSGNAPEPSTGKPELTCDYTAVNGGTEIGNDTSQYAPKKDSDIKLTVTAGGKNITAHTEFTNLSPTHQGAADHQFTVYVRQVVLTFGKVNTKNEKLEGAVFQVYNQDGEIVGEGTSDEKGEVRIEGLPKGELTMKEVAAPDGYVTGNIIWKVIVDEDGNVTLKNTTDEEVHEIINYTPDEFLDNSLKYSKTAELAKEQGSWDNRIYNININAHSELLESSSSTIGGVADTVMVLDRSGSMRYGNGASSNSYITSYTQVDRDDMVTSKVYYYNKSYQNPIKYIDGQWKRYSNSSWSSMTDRDYSYVYTWIARMTSLKDAASAFIENTGARSPESKIGVVSFAASESRDADLITASSNTGVLLEAVNQLRPNGGTRPDLGLKEALDLFDSTSKVPKYAILFTDGKPESGGASESTLRSYAENAANALKEAGVKVFVVGLGLKDNDGDQSNEWLSTKEWITTKIAFSPEYCFTTDEASDLEQIFEKISSTITKATDIANATIKDVVSPGFEIVTADNQTVTKAMIDAAKKQGKDGYELEGGYVNIETINGKECYTITWKGETIKTAEGGGWSGSFKVKAKDTFIGGNDVATNVSPDSVIEAPGLGTAVLPEPTVNVKAAFQVKNAENTIFWGDGIPVDAASIARIFDENAVTNTVNGSKVTFESATATGSFKMTWYSDKECTKEVIAQQWENMKPEFDQEFYLKVEFQPKSDGSASAEASGGNVVSTVVGVNEKDAGKEYGVYTIHVVKGQLDITKEINKQYTDVQAINSQQSFVFRVDRRETPGTEITDTYYAVLGFDANSGNLTDTDTLSGLKKGYYTITEQTEWSSKYTQTEVTDNYDGKIADHENAVNLFIGEKLEDKNNKCDFYGTEDGTYDAYANSHKAAVAFENELKSDWKWLSDVASVVNEFTK
ncbi:VWA domain-containing protein [Lactonifactor longoviformis]|uniref:von Willebrand factor type A domain-containing protein n=1 Tax=Lactonifactor longoviformis DSM 17459 TaxID=1122155 RepID=A0A1M4VY12_9CLOT|nr:VWA domain-containing protein [Lactonifactor longoviformis]POP34800.1 VWA domain-containing protein [Lactonifactor longoviformis]SHE73847.1 von Willebrand factor type A domain-containing protein [Lactonifactor longoviformis DSM 17459]